MTDATETLSLVQLKINDVKEDIAKLQTKLADLEARQQAEALTEAVAVGDTVTAKFGRGDKTRDVTGVVTAIGSDPKQGKLLALSVGEGLDTQIIKVRAADLKLGA